MKQFVYPSERYPLRERVCVSFSGGKTSAYMTKMLLDHFRPRGVDVSVVFANTGQEHPKTLEFVHKCDEYFGFGTVWIEADVDPRRGKGTKAKIVDFETASRDGKPFEDYIRKYGVPNRMYNQCTSRLKSDPMDHYRRHVLGWKKDSYSTAIGIRADEMDRVSITGMAVHGFFYPCVDAGVTKQDVKEWWEEQPFNLEIPEHLGNCVWCWKKSNRKLLTIAKHYPRFFDFPWRMEEFFSLNGGPRRDGAPRQRRFFFRGDRSTEDILASAQQDFEEFTDNGFIEFDPDLDVGSGCGESCEIGADID